MFEAVDSNRRFPGTFPYHRCTRCHLVFIAEVPNDLGLFYGGGYQPIPASAEAFYPLSAREAYRLDAVLKYKKSGKLLEIGPWIGLFSYAAKTAGFDVTAIEINTECVEFLQKKLGIRTIQSVDPTQTLRDLNESFDVIALWHSIEHLPRPWELIGAASARLSPNGILVVAAPNPDSAQFSVLGKRWYHLDAPRHLYFLPAAMVSAIGADNGLRTVSMTTRDRLGGILTRIGWDDFVGRFMPIPGLRRAVRRLLSPILIKHFGDDNEGKGAGYTAVLQRQG